MSNIMIIADYQSVYGGNFIASLIALEDSDEYSNDSFIYVFPETAQHRLWIDQMKREGRHIEFAKFKSGNKTLYTELKRFISTLNINILYFHFGHVQVAEKIANKNKNLRVYIHVHSDFSAGKKVLKVQLRNFLLYRMNARNVKFITVSERFVDYNPAKFTFIPNGLAEKRIGCKHINGKELRKLKGIQDDCCLVEVFGWSPIIKGVDIAVEAVKQIRDEYKKKVCLAIICGREYTVDKMKKFVSENTSCSGEENFIFYFEPTEDVFSYHEASDIHLSSSRSEGFSYSILEMLSIGKRCVISDLPGVSWAKRYKTTSYFESESVEECVKSLLYSLDKSNYEEEVARDICLNYSIHKWVESISQIVK